MGKLYCLIGKSASGKDSIYKRIIERRPQLGRYVMYTTRPIREGEVPGVSYNYTDEAKLADYKAAGRLIESRTYDTVYGPWTYATIDDGQIELDKRNYLMPATLESYLSLRNYFGTDKVAAIYIELDDGVRLMRALTREMREENPKYKELCRRFIADSEDFSEEKLLEAGIGKRFVNDDLEACVDEIIDYCGL